VRLIGDITVCDIPSARVRLVGLDETTLELLMRHGGKTTRTQPLRETAFSIEALDESLKRLETMGILRQNSEASSRQSFHSPP